MFLPILIISIYLASNKLPNLQNLDYDHFFLKKKKKVAVD